ncbi:MAG: PatB family C-S lyase [Thermoflexales bacterium]|nr:PatB family C-S lyase [Thermoflexales bacterium]
MAYDFDRLIDRRGSDSVKWHRYGEDVLPMWVADMDLAAPEPVLRALRERLDHGVFGYPSELPELREIIVDRLQRLYSWSVPAEALLFLPGVVVGFNLACHAVASPGDGVLVQTPVYFPFLEVPRNTGLTLDAMELTRQADGRYEIDFERFERTITDRTRVFILCNPHNPVGRVFRRDELARMAEICSRYKLVICSDEIHCDLLYPPNRHLPIASLSGEIADRTITLMAPSKTFNIPGLQCSVAIVTDPELREKFKAAHKGLVSWVNVMGQVAAVAAYRDGQPWLDELLRYLEANRDFVHQYVSDSLRGVTANEPGGTYLAWLDCREAGIVGNPHEFFLKEAKVAVNDGASFGRGGEGFVRLNFGCPRSTLAEALERMKNALAAIP